MVSHWFSASQWQLPDESDYLKLQALFARVAEEKHQRGELEKPHHQLLETYTSLNRQYAELQSEYKHLRRYFGVTAQVPYTDVWTHKPVQYYPGKHPCEKPAEMLQQIISASSRPGDLVADFFMGRVRQSKQRWRWDVVQLALSWRLNVLSRLSGKFRI